MSPRVSVVMPFRNAAATLAEAIGSVLAAPDPTLELLLVDDGSEDESRAIAARIADPRVRLLDNDDSPGIVGSLNTGARAARGEWIGRMDADDIALPDRFTRCLNRAAAADAPGVVAGGVELMDCQGDGMLRYVEWVNGLDGHEAMAAGRFIESPVVHPSVMIRSDWLERVGGYRDVPWAEDHDLWLRLFEAGCRFAKVRELVLRWRDSAERLTRRDPRYGDAARLAMRAHFLGRMPEVALKGVVIAGAGPNGKQLCRLLLKQGTTVHALAEVHPRRVGETIHGVPVIPSAEVDRWQGRAVLLGAVGGERPRARVRQWAVDTGWTEGGDFWQVA